MSVSPDFLLQSSPDLRASAPPAKALADRPQGNQDKASSFSDVYAEQRQQQADESRESAKAHSEGAEAKAGAEAENSDELADSGNNLPLGDGSLTQAQAADELLVGTLLPLATEAAEPLEADVMVEPVVDPDVLALLPNMMAPANQQAETKVTLSPGALAAQKVAAEQGTHDDKTLETNALLMDEAALEEASVLTEGLGEVVLKETEPSQARQEVLASKLNLIAQAISPNNPVQPRAPLVPGAPLAVGQPGMNEAVVDKVMWLSSQNLKSAEIQLDPAELGRMEVRIELSKDQAAQVTFISASAQVREQLEGQAHRLRELFSQQGMAELDVSVSDQSLARGSDGQDQGSSRRARFAGESAEGDEQLIGVSELRTGSATAPRGLVDFYA